MGRYGRWMGLSAAAGAALLWALAAAGPGAGAAPPVHGGSVDCAECHACPAPTRAEPCLKACPRGRESKGLTASQGPDVVILKELEDMYVPVRFNHRAHAQMAGMSRGCVTCHHNTPPDSAHPSCKDCHPKTAAQENLAQPSLKGAYHRQCLSCHSEWDRDTACEVCHEKKAGGALHGTASAVNGHSHYRAIPLDDLITFKTNYAPGDVVPFHHRNHSEKYERDCVECHAQQGCTKCHTQGVTAGANGRHPMGDPSEAHIHQTVCFQCHQDQKCTECHGRDPKDLFSHADTGWPLAPYHAHLDCRSCHGASGAFQKPDPTCTSCHEQGFRTAGFKHDVTGVKLGATHGEIDCETCHTAGVGKGEPSCEGCHDDGRSYDRKTGFGDS